MNSATQDYVQTFFSYMPEITSLSGLLLYFLFAYLASLCCVFLTRQLHSDMDIQKAMKDTIAL